MLVQVQGMKKLEAAVKPGNYNNLWCAGKSVEIIYGIKKSTEIIYDLEVEMMETINLLKGMVKE